MTLDLFLAIFYVAGFALILGLGGFLAWCLGYRD